MECARCSKQISGYSHKCLKCGNRFCSDCYKNSPFCKTCFESLPKTLQYALKRKHVILQNIYYMIFGALLVGFIALELTESFAFGVAFVVIVGLMVLIAIFTRVSDSRFYKKKVRKLEPQQAVTA